MSEIFERFKGVIASQGVDSSTSPFNPPATARQLEDAEAEIGIRLPDSVRSLYLAADGMRYDDVEARAGSCFAPAIFPNSVYWVDLSRMLTQWDTDRGCAEIWEEESEDEAHPGDLTRAVRFSERWIPIGRDHTTRNVYLDLDPGPTGVSGQLFAFDGVGHTNYSARFAESFPAYLEQLAYCIERGLVSWRDGSWCRVDGGKAVVSLWEVTGRDWAPTMS